ncbi:F-box protein SKIP16 [Impatiens glandulifera]|uniref:F-box protein SKIP16 n=1 Tax=Impatiens glandulifera TaxID=253017 RepID=UPI001FB0EC7A|nr:F-box protein SKIP16 [Impatiens glandulifera]
METVGGFAVHEILLRLSSKDAASLACVNSKFRIWASDETLWSNFCADELDLTSPVDPFGNPTSTFKEAYKRWKESFSMYPWPLVGRSKRCWDRIKSWFLANFPEAFATLRAGASEDELTNLENQLNVKLPLPTRILYRFCDGQEFNEDDEGNTLDNWMGLIGGYIFYHQVVNVFLFPVRHVIAGTKNMLRQLDFPNRSKYIIVAASLTDCGKFFFLNCDNGQLFVGTENLTGSCKMMPCVPKSLISSMHDCDAMLLWLEEHSRRLHNGTIRVCKEGEVKYLNLFHEEPPLCTTAVTNGVKVRASAILVPELSNLLREPANYMFAYSIRISLLPEGCIINGMHFDSCQLLSRHWTIIADDVVVSNVNGEAVIGKYPLLFPGEREFVYESCSPLSSTSGSIEGSFTFVPGSLVNPKGSPFKVKVAQFPLKLPDYIF